MTRATPLLAARGAGRRFGHRDALEPVELEIWDGEAVALVGPNGAGKSTLLALLAGALEASVGSIERRKGARVGWAPQRPAQYGRLSARENLELFAKLEGEHDPQGAAARLLREFELPGEPEPSANLSVGNRQRLNLAIAQLGAPHVLLLDEPTAALDAPDTRFERPGEQRQQRRLAGAVRPDERDRLAVPDLELDRLERARLPVPPRCAAGRKEWCLQAQRLAAAGGSAGGSGATDRVPSTSTSTGIVLSCSHDSSETRSPKNSQIARPAASSGSATSAPGSP